MSAEDIEYMDDYKEFPTKESALDRLDNFLNLDERNNLIRALQQEPRTGHWISHREHCENLGVLPSGLGAYEWCSNCDCAIDVREWHRNHYNFCPNCGAKMAESEET